MEPEQLCQYLEDLIRQLGISLRYENLRQPGYSTQGGLCSIKGKHHLIIEKSNKTPEKIKQLVQCLRGMDLEGIYIKPAVRESLNIPYRERKTAGKKKEKEKDDVPSNALS
jgi:hypothetical protein